MNKQDKRGRSAVQLACSRFIFIFVCLYNCIIVYLYNCIIVCMVQLACSRLSNCLSLTLICCRGRGEVVQLLIEEGADAECAMVDGWEG